MIKFRDWLVIRENIHGGVSGDFPTLPAERNPYFNGKFSTSAFTTGKAKIKKNSIRDAEEQKRKNLDPYNF